MATEESTTRPDDDWDRGHDEWIRTLAAKASEAAQGGATPEERLAAAIEAVAENNGWSSRSTVEALECWNALNQGGWSKHELLHRTEEAAARDKLRQEESRRAAEAAERNAREAEYAAMLAASNARHVREALAAAEKDFQFAQACDLKVDGRSPNRWLINDVLREGEPCIVAGPEKALKASILVDMAVSLASREGFLDCFVVPEQVRVAMFTGESSRAVILRKIELMCEQKERYLSTFSLALFLTRSAW